MKEKARILEQLSKDAYGKKKLTKKLREEKRKRVYQIQEELKN